MFVSHSERWRGGLSLWGVLFLVWCAANVPLSRDGALIGLGVSFCIAFTLSYRLPGAARLWSAVSFTPRRMRAFLRYTAVFLREMVKSNLKVLSYVYARKVNIRPGIVATRTRLTTPFARLALANTVALTPGSLVMGLEGQIVYLHGLDLDTTDIDANTKTYLSAFDPILEQSFG